MAPYFPEFLQNFDILILNRIQDIFGCRFFDSVMPIISFLGDGGWIWIVTALVLICFKKTRKSGFSVAVALLLGLVFGNIILKNLFARIRPYELENALISTPLIDKPTDFSFPSGHTLASFEAATVLFIKDKRFGIPALILAVLIAFSRLYLYVHFPTDIIGGIVLGIAFALCGTAVINAVYKKLKKDI